MLSHILSLCIALKEFCPFFALLNPVVPERASGDLVLRIQVCFRHQRLTDALTSLLCAFRGLDLAAYCRISSDSPGLFVVFLESVDVLSSKICLAVR
uniref:ACT domain-containing protein n=1 Tax=Physcomitrium patens TaxID=3218 RepID=A0A2K1IFM2_PHYPA|nr:hypothetical protein PHYPA_028660 [Physcomitrium patens]